ncbi:hypothetical protein [Mycobacterium sp. SMC-4]
MWSFDPMVYVISPNLLPQGDLLVTDAWDGDRCRWGVLLRPFAGLI